MIRTAHPKPICFWRRWSIIGNITPPVFVLADFGIDFRTSTYQIHCQQQLTLLQLLSFSVKPSVVVHITMPLRLRYTYNEVLRYNCNGGSEEHPESNPTHNALCENELPVLFADTVSASACILRHHTVIDLTHLVIIRPNTIRRFPVTTRCLK
jgi:hypothetical protein